MVIFKLYLSIWFAFLLRYIYLKINIKKYIDIKISLFKKNVRKMKTDLLEKQLLQMSLGTEGIE